ncbi:toll/interleukin-1 receptor domain-containing protein [Paludisphaera soli]|uniref:toll/interleukin-1 receptor domain-containing protein n=1 Tax=Paludisphaera soli TaxID=2712865 RepID=UPI0013EDB810|nr:toll/interleukin-1 receptor domain-containing protein [Paludisphaera soli]
MSNNDQKRYHAFLSYNSADRPAVRQLAERLRAEGLELYLEEWELAPGREFQAALAEGLRDSKSCVVFLGPSGLGPWQKQELQVAIDRRAREESFPVVPVLLPGAERPRRGDVALLEFLINASWVEFLKTLDDEAAFRGLVWGVTGVKPRATDVSPYEGKCPYRGLEAFGPGDAKYFFGRAALTGWLASELRREVRSADGVRLLAVLGPSGSGKSSVVLAGLVPSLKEGAIEGSASWPVAILRPGGDPLKNLAEKLVPLLRAEVRPDASLSEAAEQKELLVDLQGDGDEAPAALDRYAGLKFAPEPEGRRLLIVVDQFEEIFTHRPQDDHAKARFEKSRDAFVANLLHAASAPGGRVVVVLTMRSDFLGRCAASPRLAAALGSHQQLVGFMTPAELREAIERPAFLAGCEVEPALTERLLADVRGQAGSLPLLQFALTELWKKRDVRRLTLASYEALGTDEHGERRGVERVLENRAEEVYLGLDPEDQELSRRLFLRLVQPGEGAEDTKRRISYDGLLPDDPGRAAAFRRLIQALSGGAARLVTTDAGGGGSIEVAHEALIRGWSRLRGWIEADRAGMRIRDRLAETAREWSGAASEHKADYLYAGAQLALAREWASAHRDELSALEVAFLGTGEEAERQRTQDEAEQQRRLREAAEEAAEAERKRAEEAELRQQAETARAEAEAARAREAEARERAEQGRTLEAERATTEAVKREDAERRRAEEALTSAEGQRRAAERERRLGRRYQRVAGAACLLLISACGLGYWANSARIDAESNERIAESRRLAALSEAARPLRLDRALLLAVEASRGPDTIEARASLQHALDERPEVVRFSHVPEGGVGSVAFDSGGTLAVSQGGTIALFDSEGKRLHLDPLLVAEAHVIDMAFAPGKDLMLVAGYSRGEGADARGGVALFDRSGHLFRTVDVAEGPVTSVAVDAAGAFAAGFGPRHEDDSEAGGGVILFEINGRKVSSHDVPEGYVRDVVLASGENPGLAVGYARGEGHEARGGVILFNPGGRKHLDVPEGFVLSVSFGPSETLTAAYITDSGSGVVRFDGEGRRVGNLPLRVEEGHVGHARIGPNGDIAVTYNDAARGGGIVVFDAAGRRSGSAPMKIAEGRVNCVSFGPRGILAAGYAPNLRDNGLGGVVLLDPARRQRPATPLEGTVSSVAFNPSGILAVGHRRKRGGDVVSLLDVDGRPGRDASPAINEGYVRSVAFSPRGVLAVGVEFERCENDVARGGVVQFDAEVHRSGLLEIPWGPVTSVACDSSGTVAAAYATGEGVDARGGVALIDATGRLTSNVEVPEGHVTGVAYGPGEGFAVAYSRDGGESDLPSGGVVFFDTKGRRLRTAEIPTIYVTGVSINRSGLLAAGYGGVGGSGGVALFEMDDRSAAARYLAVPEGYVNTVAFGPKDALAVGYGRVGGASWGVVLFDAKGRRQRTMSLDVKKGSIRGLAFDATGILAVGYNATSPVNNGVFLLDADPTSWLSQAQAIANRNFTRAEWADCFPDFPQSAPYRRTIRSHPWPHDLTGEEKNAAVAWENHHLEKEGER